MNNITTVKKEYHNMTLEHYLLITYPEYSRSYMSKLIKSGMVAVNDIVSDSRLKRIIHNDKVEIEFRDKVGDTILSENIPFEIIFENDDLLVINKEEGVVVHPGAGQESGTLLNAVKHYLKEDSQPVMVNRIDKETSGIVLVAKTPKSREVYAKQFENREVSKTYLCVVSSKLNPALDSKYGTVAEDGFQIEGMIGRNKRNRKIQYLFETKVGKIKTVNRDKLNLKTADRRFSLTQFRHYNENPAYITLSVFPVTGRTHQIRAHLKAIDFPIIGDLDYSGEKFARLMLHSWKLSIQVDGKNQNFETKIPSEFDIFL
ncbi:RluA family pseudouridine synthase [bacterium]|nr:MAG: RluA family pseudouridine synthase [bacterium]